MPQSYNKKTIGQNFARTFAENPCEISNLLSFCQMSICASNRLDLAKLYHSASEKSPVYFWGNGSAIICSNKLSNRKIVLNVSTNSVPTGQPLAVVVEIAKTSLPRHTLRHHSK